MNWIQTFSILLFLFLMAPATNFAQSASKQESQTKAQAQTITVKVKGVGCSKDIKTIATSVKELSGVSSCDVAKKGATTSYNITYNPSLVSRNQIESAIEDTPGCKNPNDRPYKVKQ